MFVSVIFSKFFVLCYGLVISDKAYWFTYVLKEMSNVFHWYGQSSDVYMNVGVDIAHASYSQLEYVMQNQCLQ